MKPLSYYQRRAEETRRALQAAARGRDTGENYSAEEHERAYRAHARAERKLRERVGNRDDDGRGTLVAAGVEFSRS